MACLDMYNKNNDPKNLGPPPPPISPRISFSNDFVDSASHSNSHHHHHHQNQNQVMRAYRDAPVSSSDFEFSVTNYSMMSADELFSQGRLLPLKESSSNQKTTLREELMVEDDRDHDFSLRPPKSSSTKWKGFLGLKKSHIGSKKIDKTETSSADKRSTSASLHLPDAKTSQVH